MTINSFYTQLAKLRAGLPASRSFAPLFLLSTLVALAGCTELPDGDVQIFNHYHTYIYQCPDAGQSAEADAAAGDAGERSEGESSSDGGEPEVDTADADGPAEDSGVGEAVVPPADAAADADAAQ